MPPMRARNRPLGTARRQHRGRAARLQAPRAFQQHRHLAGAYRVHAAGFRSHAQQQRREGAEQQCTRGKAPSVRGKRQVYAASAKCTRQAPSVRGGALVQVPAVPLDPHGRARPARWPPVRAGLASRAAHRPRPRPPGRWERLTAMLRSQPPSASGRCSLCALSIMSTNVSRVASSAKAASPRTRRAIV